MESAARARRVLGGGRGVLINCGLAAAGDVRAPPAVCSGTGTRVLGGVEQPRVVDGDCVDGVGCHVKLGPDAPVLGLGPRKMRNRFFWRCTGR